MTNRTIKHEIKLQKSVIIILGVLAVGVFANAFAPVFSVKDAKAGGPQSICNQYCVDVISTYRGDALLVKVVD